MGWRASDEQPEPDRQRQGWAEAFILAPNMGAPSSAAELESAYAGGDPSPPRLRTWLSLGEIATPRLFATRVRARRNTGSKTSASAFSASRIGQVQAP